MSAATKVSLATQSAAKSDDELSCARATCPSHVFAVARHAAASDQRLHRDPPFVSQRKKVGETAKSAIWIPLRGVTIRREATSHEAESAPPRGAGERRERPPQPPRVQQGLQFSLNIVISYNVLCRFFFRRRRHRRRLDVSLPTSIILPVRMRILSQSASE